MDTAIFSPMFGMFILTSVVWIYMYAKRIPWITQANLTDEDLTPARFMALQPPEVANPSDNLKNLFEMPLLFYALVLYLYVTGHVDQIHVISAWAFFVLRIAHSIMHCTRNVVIVRFWIYALSCVAFFVMLVRAIAQHLG